MKNTLIAATASAALMSALIAAPAFAQSVSAGASTTVGTGGVRANAAANMQTRITNAISRADQEITRRITALTDMGSKVQAMVKVSSDMKASVTNDVASEISTLNALKAKIDAETDITALKADIKSIAADYRVYMLVMPVSRIQVAADKINTVVSSYTEFAAKLQTRISEAQAAGKDVTALNASLSGMNAKTADATTQANAAVSLVSNLKPDNGDQTLMQSNQAAIKSARTKIQAALADLKTARQDAGQIVKGIESFHLGANANATTSASTQ